MNINAQNDDLDFDTDFEVEVTESHEDEVENPRLANMKWYILQTVSGYEQKASTLLEAAIKDSEYSQYFGQILIPLEKVVTRVGAKVKKSERKIFPNYIFVQMEMNFSTMSLVRSVSHIIGFVGQQKGKQPEPMRQAEMDNIFRMVKESELNPTETYKITVGDIVAVVAGPFKNHSGEVTVVEKETVSIVLKTLGKFKTVELPITEVKPITDK